MLNVELKTQVLEQAGRWIYYKLSEMNQQNLEEIPVIDNGLLIRLLWVTLFAICRTSACLVLIIFLSTSVKPDF